MNKIQCFRLRRPACVVVAVALVLGRVCSGGQSIVDSPHNMSAQGPGAVRALTETEICIFCHTPHGATADAPLWNRYSFGENYQTYDSTTAKATTDQPTGASKLCLSCHDGTVALGLVRSRPSVIEFGGGTVKMPAGHSNLGTDLSDDHPVSFVYDAHLAQENVELRDPGTLAAGPVRLDKNRRLQCTACHNAHDNQYGRFLVKSNLGSALCLTCHEKTYWDSGVHRTSSATWNGQLPDPWPWTAETTVAANGCENCHAPHGAQTPPRLLYRDGEEQNCYACHNGHVAAKNIESVFAKDSAHPVSSTLHVHDPLEDAINPARHVECADCHNPHAAKASAASAPDAPGSLAGVKGVNVSGTAVKALTKEYELCFRCHADSLSRGEALVVRQFPQTNTRTEFSPTSRSFHPIETIGRNPNVPSLVNPYRTDSLLYCTDCHNNDQGPGANGTGPNGPHGSRYEPILERQLVLDDNNADPEGAATYALCYKCHSQTSIMEDRSFKAHHKHIADKKTACTTCHDPHGVVSASHLINFNLRYVSPSRTNGKLEFVDTGTYSGNCSLYCHGKDHVAEVYAP